MKPRDTKKKHLTKRFFFVKVVKPTRENSKIDFGFGVLSGGIKTDKKMSSSLNLFSNLEQFNIHSPDFKDEDVPLDFDPGCVCVNCGKEVKKYYECGERFTCCNDCFGKSDPVATPVCPLGASGLCDEYVPVVMPEVKKQINTAIKRLEHSLFDGNIQFPWVYNHSPHQLRCARRSFGREIPFSERVEDCKWIISPNGCNITPSGKHEVPPPYSP